MQPSDEYLAAGRFKELSEAIAGLYATFADSRWKGPVSGCDHCTDASDDRMLRSQGLNRLSAQNLERFARKAMTTLGTMEDFKHFLPRLLEILAAAGDVGETNCEVVLGKLAYAKWMTWPAAQRLAVGRFLAALWSRVLSVFPATVRVGTWICAIGNAVDDLSPYLSSWRDDLGAASVRHLADFVCTEVTGSFKVEGLSNAFWGGRNAQALQLIDWVSDKRTLRQLEEGFFRFTDESWAEQLSIAADRLAMLR